MSIIAKVYVCFVVAVVVLVVVLHCIVKFSIVYLFKLTLCITNTHMYSHSMKGKKIKMYDKVRAVIPCQLMSLGNVNIYVLITRNE